MLIRFTEIFRSLDHLFGGQNRLLLQNRHLLLGVWPWVMILCYHALATLYRGY